MSIIGLNVCGLSIRQDDYPEICSELAPASLDGYAWSCTREAGHNDLHVASDGDEVCFIWGAR